MSNQQNKAKIYPTHTNATEEQEHNTAEKPFTLWHDVLKKHNGGKIPKKGTDEYEKVKAIYDELKQKGINKRNTSIPNSNTY
jgi:hypothetical protein